MVARALCLDPGEGLLGSHSLVHSGACTPIVVVEEACQFQDHSQAIGCAPPRQQHVSAIFATDPRLAFRMILVAFMLAVIALTARVELIKGALTYCFDRYSGQRSFTSSR